MPLWPVWFASLCAYSCSSAPSFSVWAITDGAKHWLDTTHHFQGVRKLKWMNSLLTPTFILGTCFLNWIWHSLVPGCAGSAGWCCLSCLLSRSTSTTRRKPSSPAWTASGSAYCRVLDTGIPWCSEPRCGVSTIVWELMRGLVEERPQSPQKHSALSLNGSPKWWCCHQYILTVLSLCYVIMSFVEHIEINFWNTCTDFSLNSNFDVDEWFVNTHVNSWF